MTLAASLSDDTSCSNKSCNVQVMSLIHPTRHGRKPTCNPVQEGTTCRGGGEYLCSLELRPRILGFTWLTANVVFHLQSSKRQSQRKSVEVEEKTCSNNYKCESIYSICPIYYKNHFSNYSFTILLKILITFFYPVKHLITTQIGVKF